MTCKSVDWTASFRPMATLLMLFCYSLTLAAQDSASSRSEAKQAENEAVSELQFAFEGAAWRDVIRWIADEAQLALQYVDLPTGSFTYSDPNAYSPQEAIDRINLFLLPQGFTLVRSGQLLSVINLGDPRSKQQLDSLARMVPAEQLSELEDHQVVKSLFRLGPLEADEAVDELAALNLMTEPAVFSKTNQLLITDTVAKLKSVKQVLDAFQPDEMQDGRVVESFTLNHVDAEDVLVVARPHLGLATGEMIGIDVSLSADPTGTQLFVTGVEDKVKLVEGLIASIDKPEMKTGTTGADAILQSYPVDGGNLETVYNVLQTLLAGKSVRLSTDQDSGSIVALAPPAVQQEIEATVAQLQASGAEFEVIPLNAIDPYFAISLLEGMLDLPDEFDDPEEIDPDTPRIDADPAGRRLFVRAKPAQLKQIKQIIAGLDNEASSVDGEQLRVFPLSGKQATSVLRTAAKFWRGDNPVIVYRPTIDPKAEAKERVVSEEQSDRETLTSRGELLLDSSEQRWMTANPEGTAPAIRCQLTSRGLLLQSEDPQALDKFEQHLRLILGPTDSVPSPPIVFYLKYTKPDDALRMLAELIDGGEVVSEGTSATLVNGYVSSGSDSLLGSLVTARDGTTTLIAGSLTVVADARLNRLIAQGTTDDIQRIEDYLQIIDKDTSLTSIETYGKSHVIELYNSKASEVAEALREAFAGRVDEQAGSTGGRGQGGGGQGTPQDRRQAAREQEQQRDRDSDNDQPANPQGGAGQGGGTNEPKMTIAVHEPSNSLIVTAPDQLFSEVEILARSIDTRGEEAVEVVTPANAEVLEQVLQQLMLGEVTSTRRPNSSRERSSRAREQR